MTEPTTSPRAHPVFDRIVPYVASSGHNGEVRVRFFRYGASRVLLLTDIALPSHKPSVTNELEAVVTAADATGEVAARLATIVEHYESPTETFDEVVLGFLPDGRVDRTRLPVWTRRSKATIEEMIGGSLA